MALYQLSSARGAGAKLAAMPVELPRYHVVPFALVVAHASVYLLRLATFKGTWLIAPDGGGVPVRLRQCAGRPDELALAGHAAAAYDWPAHKLAEESAVGHPFDGYFGWHYPPTFLFAAAALSLLPYAAAYVVWLFATFPAYLAAIRAIIGDRVGYFLGAAFPAVLANFIVGQNGFLTAGLVGGALVLHRAAAARLRGVLCSGCSPTSRTSRPVVSDRADSRAAYWRTFVSAGDRRRC